MSDSIDDPCYVGSEQPLSASQPAIDAAHAATVGTNDTVNALIQYGMPTLTAVVNAEETKGVLATKATTQIASQGITATTLIVIAIIAVVGFIAFAKFRSKG